MKTVFFIRYVNAGCEIHRFNSVTQACKWVFNNQSFNTKNVFSQNAYKIIHSHIKHSKLNGIPYCGGHWIICERGGEA